MSRRTKIVIGASGMRDGRNRARDVTLTSRVSAVILGQPANTRVKNERDTTPVRSCCQRRKPTYLLAFHATFTLPTASFTQSTAGCGSADAGKLLAEHHVQDACAADLSFHQDHAPVRFDDFANDGGVLAEAMPPHLFEYGIGHLGGNHGE